VQVDFRRSLHPHPVTTMRSRVSTRVHNDREGRMPITRVKFHHLFHRDHYKLDFRFPRPRALHIPI